ncbi:peptidoglycan editing factor PgeF [Solibacillus sp. FSL K6-1523]|uniref:peptidoglycan editing factor PgeF n=1 Tax=Solibacillus sp. FSL K6-1523 TaxID=2921471 RepID=UPI0030F9C41A
MKQKFYVQNEKIIAGITLKDASHAEQNNMAFNVCQNKISVLENRQQLADVLQTDIGQFVCANQTHSANFLKVEKEHIGLGAHDYESSVLNTDALYTFEKNIVISSFTADCVPVLFYNPKIELIGAIHSGWQGSVKEITRHLFEHLKTNEACQMSDLQVFIGPALSQEKFEVDTDVYEQFKALGYADDFMYYNDATNKYHIDNQLTVQKQCELAGVPTENIQLDPMCTFLDESGFSYRQSKQAGRHLSFIMQK